MLERGNACWIRAGSTRAVELRATALTHHPPPTAPLQEPCPAAPRLRARTPWQDRSRPVALGLGAGDAAGGTSARGAHARFAPAAAAAAARFPRNSGPRWARCPFSPHRSAAGQRRPETPRSTTAPSPAAPQAPPDQQRRPPARPRNTSPPAAARLPRKRKSLEAAVPLLPLGVYGLRRRGEAGRGGLRRRRPFRPLLSSPRRGLPPRLRHAPRFPE